MADIVIMLFMQMTEKKQRIIGYSAFCQFVESRERPLYVLLPLPEKQEADVGKGNT